MKKPASALTSDGRATLDQPAALTMLGMICTATYPLVYPVLRSDKTLRQDLAKVLAHALDGCPPEQFFGVSALKVRPEFIQLMGAVAVLDAICRSPGASSRDKYDFAEDTAETLFPALHKWCASALKGGERDSNLEYPVDLFVSCMVATHYMLEWNSEAARRGLNEKCAAFTIGTRQRIGSMTPLQISEQVLLEQATRTACAGPGCTIAMLNLDHHDPNQICNRCRITRYCSRECQRRDWVVGSEGGIPHKRFCVAASEARRLGMRGLVMPGERRTVGCEALFGPGKPLEPHAPTIIAWARGCGGFMDPRDAAQLKRWR